MPFEFLSSGTLENIRKNSLFGVNQQINQRYGDLTDFGSEFYQKYRQWLASQTPTQGVNTQLAGLQAGGGNFGASQVQSRALQRGFEGRRNEFLNTSTSGFALGSQGQANSLLGMLSGNQQFLAQLRQQQSQFEESQGGFLDFLGTLGGAGLGFLAGGPAGAFAGASAGSQLFGGSSGGGGGNQSRRSPARPNIY